MVKYQVGRSFSVHDGNQSNLFAGINAYEYAGKTYTRTWQHSDASCADCHMNTFNPADSTGGHSLKPKKAECTACHLGDRITPVQENIEIKRIELAELLVARKVFKQTTNSSGAISYSALQTHDFFGVLFPTVQETTKFAIALAAANGNMANWEPLTIMAKSTANYQKGYTILFTPCRCCRILSIG